MLGRKCRQHQRRNTNSIASSCEAASLETLQCMLFNIYTVSDRFIKFARHSGYNAYLRLRFFAKWS